LTGSDAAAENKILAWIDAAGFPFRETLGALVDAHGLADNRDWHDWPLCAPATATGSPLLTQLVRPFGFHVTDYSARADWLDQFHGAVDAGSPAASFAFAREALFAVLGPGAPSLAPSGAEQIDWAAGAWAVNLSGLHETSPGAPPWTRCALVQIHTGWRPQLPARVLAALGAFRAHAGISLTPHTAFAPPDIAFDLPPERAPPPGVGVLDRGGDFICVDETGAVWIPRAALCHVRHTLIHPARAGGSEEVAVHYVTEGFHGPVARNCSLASGYAEGAHGETAAALAALLDLPLQSEEYAND
jgi:hypothetical protein